MEAPGVWVGWGSWRAEGLSRGSGGERKGGDMPLLGKEGKVPFAGVRMNYLGGWEAGGARKRMMLCELKVKKEKRWKEKKQDET